MLLYLECRFSNSITTSSCDCAQILTDVKPGAITDMLPVNNHANHKHLPEEYEYSAQTITAISLKVTVQFTPIQKNKIATGFPSSIFHPPLSQSHS
ncbi:MAG TPA: hypothetical protein VGD17_03810 [Chitinophagaceae bacterium]